MQKTIIRRKKLSQLNADTNFSRLLKNIYENRGIQNLSELDYQLAVLTPYDTLKDIEIAVALLYQHLQKDSKILVVGDFDADGATSCALAVSALQSFGAKNVRYLVPNRFEFGYGLTPEIIKVAKSFNPNLLITVDNGISSIEGVMAAKNEGIDVLITDHHLQGNELPKADAIVNPNQHGDLFPSKNLAGVGVIFYVMLALRRYLIEKSWFKKNQISEPNMAQFLDLVALGTVADVVPLDQNNRILVQQGLRRIRANLCRPGIKALLDVAKRNQTRLSASDLSFALGPRLNAAGRLDDMSIGIECLLAKNYEQAIELAEVLSELNQERKFIEAEMQQQAFAELKKINFSKDLPIGICLYNENWHQGVIGILASRIKDQFHRPVIAFAHGDNNLLKGSARSIHGLHIRDILDAIATANPGLIEKFGGHAMAAGLSLEEKKFSEFTRAFTKEVRKHLTAEDLTGKVFSDGELHDSEFNLETAELIKASGPWGQHFPEPLFDGKFTVISQHIVGAKHLKMVLSAGSYLQLDAIAFNVDVERWPNHRCEKIHAAYRLDINEYMGRQSLQLLIEHLEPCEN